MVAGDGEMHDGSPGGLMKVIGHVSADTLEHRVNEEIQKVLQKVLAGALQTNAGVVPPPATAGIHYTAAAYLGEDLVELSDLTMALFILQTMKKNQTKTKSSELRIEVVFEREYIESKAVQECCTNPLFIVEDEVVITEDVVITA